jgi:hypothetical protein
LLHLRQLGLLFHFSYCTVLCRSIMHYRIWILSISLL